MPSTLAVRNLKRIGTLPLDGPVKAIDVSARNDHFMVIPRHGWTKVYRTEGFEVIRRLRVANPETLTDMRVVSEGEQIATLRTTHSCRVSVYGEGEWRELDRLPNASPSAVTISHQRQNGIYQVAYAVDNKAWARLIDGKKTEYSVRSRSVDKPITSILYSPEGKHIGILAGDYVEVLYADFSIPKRGVYRDPSVGSVRELAWDPSGDTVAAYGRLGLEMWDVHSGHTLCRITSDPRNPITAAAINGNLDVCIGYASGYLALYNEHGELIDEQIPSDEGPPGAIRCIAHCYHPSYDSIFITGDEDTNAKVWWISS